MEDTIISNPASDKKNNYTYKCHINQGQSYAHMIR